MNALTRGRHTRHSDASYNDTAREQESILILALEAYSALATLSMQQLRGCATAVWCSFRRFPRRKRCQTARYHAPYKAFTVTFTHTERYGVMCYEACLRCDAHMVTSMLGRRHSFNAYTTQLQPKSALATSTATSPPLFTCSSRYSSSCGTARWSKYSCSTTGLSASYDAGKSICSNGMTDPRDCRWNDRIRPFRSLKCQGTSGDEINRNRARRLYLNKEEDTRVGRDGWQICTELRSFTDCDADG